jgi:hypothetical protein
MQIEPSLVLPLSQIERDHDTFDLKQYTCAENNIVLPITCAHDELKLLSSLNTLGYVEFDTSCALSSLEEKFQCAELPWLSTYTYHLLVNIFVTESIWYIESIFMQI